VFCAQFLIVFGQQNQVGNNSEFECPEDGDLHPDPTSCEHFYQCVHVGTSDERAVRHRCPPRLVFSADLNYCDWARNVDCEDGVRPPDGSGDGEQVVSSMEGEGSSIESKEGDDDDDNTITREATGEEEGDNVGEEEGFIPVTSTAATTESTTTMSTTQTTTTQADTTTSQADTTTKATLPPEIPFKCPADPDKTMYVDPTDCRYYFDCAHVGTSLETAYKRRCPSNLVFNEEKRYCDWPHNVPGCSVSQGKKRRKRRSVPMK